MKQGQCVGFADYILKNAQCRQLYAKGFVQMMQFKLGSDLHDKNQAVKFR